MSNNENIYSFRDLASKEYNASHFSMNDSECTNEEVISKFRYTIHYAYLGNRYVI